MTDEQRKRLQAMIAPGQQTWDLSPNDEAAIAAVLASHAEMRPLWPSAPRHGLVVSEWCHRAMLLVWRVCEHPEIGADHAV